MVAAQEELLGLRLGFCESLEGRYVILNLIIFLFLFLFSPTFIIFFFFSFSYKLVYY